MGYTTTLSFIAHTLHAHVDRCMKTEDVACQIMKKNLNKATQEWLCTSKAEMTREAEARSWDETVGNVWHRLAACDHLLDIKSLKHGDPPASHGISFATATRHLRILGRRMEEILGKSATHQDPHQIWKDISKEQWELLLLLSGETALRKYNTALWAAGHRTVNLFPDDTATSVPHIMFLEGSGSQKHTSKMPWTSRLARTASTTIQQYLKLADWTSLLANKDSQEGDLSWASSLEIVAWQERQHPGPIPSPDTGRLIQSLIHEPSEDILLEELEVVKSTLRHDTPLTWLIDILTEELWEEEQFQGGNLLLQSGNKNI